MRFAFTLSLYIARQFTGAALAMLCALSLIVMLFDFIELLRRAADHTDISLGLIVGIAFLRLPFYMLQILPFAVLVGGIIAFWRLTRSSELIVARAAGISAWHFLSLSVAGGILIGLVASGGVSPLSSVMYARAEALDNIYLRHSGGPLAIANGQLWLRQADHGLDAQGVALLHAYNVSLEGKVVSARDVSVFRLDSHDHRLSRVEASRASLSKGFWQLSNARTIQPDHLPVFVGSMKLPTDLTAHSPFGRCPGSSGYWTALGFRRFGTGCISSRCWPCRYFAAR
jgi:lipopolysaccharide export system permease protein